MHPMKLSTLLLFAVIFLAVSCTQTKNPVIPVTYPVTEKTDHSDVYFGKKVDDPYRWLEIDTAARVKAWVEAENKVTYGYLDKIPFRTKIASRLKEIMNYEKYSSPIHAGDNYLFYKNDGLQNQSVLYIQKGLDGTPEVLLDPNKLSTDGTVTANLNGLNKTKNLASFTFSKSGSDWQEFKVMDLTTKTELKDKLEWIKFSGASWKGNGFYYSRFEKPAAGSELSKKNENQKVYYHKIGDNQEKDELVYADPKHPSRTLSADVTEDERFLVIYAAEGTSGDEIWVKDLKTNSAFTCVLPGFENNYQVVDNIEDKLLVLTDNGAQNYHLVLF